MPTLREVQTAFAEALLHGDSAAEAWIEGGGIAPATRLNVYRNNVLLSLSNVLAVAYPVVRRLVDPRFFSYAANEFICAHPPPRPSLAEYGAEFPEFLASFGPCRDLAYLPDVARLEWAIARVARSVECPALAPQALGAFAADESERLTFKFQPTIALIASPFPVDGIWRVNQLDAGDQVVDFAAGPAHIEIRKHACGISMHGLDTAAFALRAALAGGATLGVATEAALARDPEFDLARALADIFRDGTVTAVTSANRREISR